MRLVNPRHIGQSHLPASVRFPVSLKSVEKTAIKGDLYYVGGKLYTYDGRAFIDLSGESTSVSQESVSISVTAEEIEALEEATTIKGVKDALAPILKRLSE